MNGTNLYQNHSSQLAKYYAYYRMVINEAYPRGLLDKDTWEYLNVKRPVTPTDPLGHPIVSDMATYRSLTVNWWTII